MRKRETHHLLHPCQNPGLLPGSGAAILAPIRARDHDRVHHHDTGTIPPGRQGAPQGIENLLGVLGDGFVLPGGGFLEAGHGRGGAGKEEGRGERGKRRGGGSERGGVGERRRGDEGE